MSPQHVATGVFRNLDDSDTTKRGLSEIVSKRNIEVIAGTAENQLLAIIANWKCIAWCDWKVQLQTIDADRLNKTVCSVFLEHVSPVTTWRNHERSRFMIQRDTAHNSRRPV